jgi:glycosyltransferase involved in cell wall biosynthesis
MMAAMQVIYNRNVVVVPNGIDIGRIRGTKREEKTGKRILVVGRLHTVKDTQYPLGAMNIHH